MSLLYLYQNRTVVKDITIQDSDDATITPSSADKIRATILRLGVSAVLTVTSDAPTANGSSFTKGASNRLTVDADDAAAIDPGTYTLLIDFYDGSTGEWKNVDRQVVNVEET